MRSVNTRAHLTIRTVIYDAVAAEAKQIGFSISDVVNKALYDVGYGKAASQTAKPAGGKEKELPPVTVWEGDPYDDPERTTVPGRRYSRPAHRWAAYTIDKLTPKQIREREDLMKRKWPQGETVYDAGLAHEEDE